MPEPSAPPLPAGYRGRSATSADAPAVHRLITACEYDLDGRAESGPDRVAADLGEAEAPTGAATRLVHDRSSGELAGRAWVRGRRSAIDVHPDHRGRGLGTGLLAWAEARARAAGSDRLSQTVSDNDRAAAALLRTHGYGRLVSEWLLEFALTAEPVVPGPPAGVTVRPFRPGDEHAAYRVAEDAFDEWQQRRKPYEEWARHTIDRAAFAPAASRVAFAGDEMIGVVLALDDAGTEEGYVEVVAVRRDQRNRGIARLLLHDAFRTFYRRGRKVCTLGTHSDTGALALYQRLGMTVRRSSTVWAAPVTARA